MKDFQIWENTYLNDVKGMLIPSNDIYKVVDMYNISALIINGLHIGYIDKLNEVIKNLEEPIRNVTNMEEFLAEQEIKFASVE